jgi:ribosomal protein S12 methylthiotransferase
MKGSNNVYVYVVSLGCDKNRIDTEHMLGVLSGSNAVITDEPEGADVIIVNTCGFIKEAKQESIDAIFEMAEYKKTGTRALIVTGCLSQRYARELEKEIPEADAFLGVSAYSKIHEAIRSALEGKKYVSCDRVDGDLAARVLTTPPHLAYVRIADGCSNRCSYCAIPAIRGPLKSRGMKNILCEIEDLRGAGVSEAILIAQDTTRYGEDLGGKALAELMDRAADIMRGGWLRVLYCYPEGVTDEIVDTMLWHENICRYMDIPLQHFSDRILGRMNRRSTMRSSKAVVKKLHRKGVTLRTSLLVGFPGETEDDFKTLMDCVEELRLEHLGVFKYSAEEGTKAAEMPDQVPEETKQSRFEAVMKLQRGISRELCQKQIGRKLRVIVDVKDGETGLCIGRTMGQAPEVDGITYIDSKKSLTAGGFHDVLIIGAEEYDLAGDVE